MKTTIFKSLAALITILMINNCAGAEAAMPDNATQTGVAAGAVTGAVVGYNRIGVGYRFAFDIGNRNQVGPDSAVVTLYGELLGPHPLRRKVVVCPAEAYRTDRHRLLQINFDPVVRAGFIG